MKITDLLGDISKYVYNPVAIRRVLFDAHEKIMNGEVTQVDATNPFSQLMEAAVVGLSAFVSEAEALLRKQYPTQAVTLDDLYPHLSDTDYINLFALPSKARFNLMFNKAELINNMVLDPLTGIKQVILPRNSTFYAADVPFSIQYPISIRMLQHGGLQAVHDGSIVSPLENLKTNVLSLETATDSKLVEYVRVGFDVQQFRIESSTIDVSLSSGYASEIQFTDQFFYARLWVRNVQGKWAEIKTTHSEQVYDPMDPTAVLRVNNGKLRVTIPVVYVTSGSIRGKVRVDIYTTRGDLTMNMENYQFVDFGATWLALDESEITPEVTALSKLREMVVWSTDTTLGGRNALTFEQVRQRAIEGTAGPRQLPITPSQAETTLVDSGYSVVKHVDSLTGRVFRATKPLPAPTGKNMYTAAAATMLPLSLTLASTQQAHGVHQHDLGATITSSALMNTNNGITSLMSSSQYGFLTSKPLADQAKLLNSGTYAFTPFYYVLDNSSETFVVRPYFMDAPAIESRSFVRENATSGMQCSIGDEFSIAKTSTGYRLAIKTASNDVYQALEDNEVFCQLAFTRSGNQRAYLNATVVPRLDDAGERTFYFDIQTNFEIDQANLMTLMGFSSSSVSAKNQSALVQDFEIFFGVTSAMPPQFALSSIDMELGVAYLPPGAVGITKERLKIKFGQALTNLWNNYRSFASEIVYQTYDDDIQAVYETDVYERDPITGSIFTIVNGEMQYNLLHRKGDLKFEANGDPIYSARRGELIIDPSTKLPIPVNNYKTRLKHVVDIFAIDAVYAFASDSITKQYVNDVKKNLLAWLTADLDDLNKEALENTSILFYPKVSKGIVQAVTGANVKQSLEAAQTLAVTIFLPSNKYQNSALKAALEETTIKTIGAYLSSNLTVDTSALYSTLKAAYGEDATGVSVRGLAGQNSDVVLTLLDSSTNLSINKVLIVQANNEMVVREDVVVDFQIHDSYSY